MKQKLIKEGQVVLSYYAGGFKKIRERSAYDN
jgi:hypothetical protein